MSMNKCSLCGAKKFNQSYIMWKQLIADWQLSPDEAHLRNINEGLHCHHCKATVRSMVLADAFCDAVGSPDTLQCVSREQRFDQLKILEINEAGHLSLYLKLLAGHQLLSWPDIDINAIEFDDDTFDIVIHSEVLEHVENPVHALSECRRVLKPGGSVVFTIPVVVGRLSRSRAGLPASYHGYPPQTDKEEYRVQTEFGSDMWETVMKAGFQNVTVNVREFPAGTAMRAIKRPEK
jgi:SAM-dependent methyltransferase